jgi:membrane protein
MKGSGKIIDLQKTGRTFIDAFWIWWHRKASQLSASLTYYTLTSLAPLLIILVSVAGIFLDPNSLSQNFLGKITLVIGSENTVILQSILVNTFEPQANFLATIFGSIILLTFASNLFRQVHYTLNLFWEIQITEATINAGPRKPILQRFLRAIWGNMILRLKAALMIFLVGGLMIISMFISTGLTIVTRVMGDLINPIVNLYQLINLLVTFGMVMVLFALLYGYIPEIKFPWKYVWQGAAIGATLFTALQYLISLYLGFVNMGSAYGAAGSLIVLLFWVYYSNQAMFFGAAFVAAKSQSRLE